MFVPKIRLSPLFYWFVNFTLADKHGTKNLLGLIRPWHLLEKRQISKASKPSVSKAGKFRRLRRDFRFRK